MSKLRRVSGSASDTLHTSSKSSTSSVVWRNPLHYHEGKGSPVLDYFKSSTSLFTFLPAVNLYG